MNTSDQPHLHAGIGAIGLMDVLRGMLHHRKKLIVFSTLLFAALGYLVIVLASPVYTASSQVLIEYEEIPYIRTDIGTQPTAPRQITDRDVRSQVEVIRSPDMALKVLNRLGLIGSREFDPLKKGLGPLARLKIALGFSPDPRRQTPEQRALRIWNKRLKVYDLPKTRVIVIEFSSSSPKIAADVANTLAEFYIEQTRSTRLAKTGEARTWLRQQIDKLRREVVKAEKAVESYRARAGLFQGVQSKLHNQELSELSAQIVRAAAERSQAEAKARAIRQLLKQGRVENSADVLSSRLIQRLREQQAQVRRRLAELSTIYLDNHPRVRAVRREMADLKRQINAEARKIAESLEQQARIAAAREAELRARQAKLKSRVSAASLDEVKLRELEREAKAQRSLLESFLARYTDALTRNDAQALPGMARIISRAIPPAAPSFPRMGPIMLLSVLAGLVLGLGLAFILEVMAAVQRAEELAQVPDTPLSHAPHAAQPHAPQPYAPQPHAMARLSPQSAAQSASQAAGQAAVMPRQDASAPAAGAQHAASQTGAALSAAERSASVTSARLDERLQGVLRATTVTRSKTATGDNAAQATTNTAAAAASSGPESADTTTAGTRPEGALHASGQPEGQLRESMQPADPLAEGVRRQLLRWQEEDGLQLVAFGELGLPAGQGSRALLDAARALARQARVILLDVADEPLRLDEADRAGRLPGLGDMLAGKAGFADIVRADVRQPHLHLTAAGRQPVRTDGAAGSQLRQLLEALRESYDLVLLHEGLPRYPLQEEQSLLPLAEAVLLVCSGEECETAEALAGLLRKRISIPSTVISPEEARAGNAVEAGMDGREGDSATSGKATGLN